MHHPHISVAITHNGTICNCLPSDILFHTNSYNSKKRYVFFTNKRPIDKLKYSITLIPNKISEPIKFGMDMTKLGD